jgi:hypothetical protein
LLGAVVDHLLGGRAMPVVIFGGASMLVAALALRFVHPEASTRAANL